MSFFSTASASSTKNAADAAAAAAESMATGGNDEGQQRRDNTPHYHFIHSMILPSTIKIQKDLKGRKFKVRVAYRCVAYSLLYSFVAFVYVCVWI